MSRLRGWCSRCGGPERSDGCRLCLLDLCGPESVMFATPHVGRPLITSDEIEAVERRDRRRSAISLAFLIRAASEATGHRLGPDVCNSTENSPATSEWLPRVWVRNSLDDDLAKEFGNVLWFGQTDETDDMASVATTSGVLSGWCASARQSAEILRALLPKEDVVADANADGGAP